MADDAKLKALIQEIAEVHGIMVGRDDPILILQTINMRLLKDGEAAQREMLAAFQSEIEQASARWADDSKKRAEQVLTAALTASKGGMEKVMQENAEKAAAAVSKEVQASAHVIGGALLRARNIAIMNMMAAGGTLVAAALLLFVAVR